MRKIRCFTRRRLFGSSQSAICVPDVLHLRVLKSPISRGLIGPKRQFGKGGVYYGEIYALLAGAMIPLFLWWWCRYRPNSPLRKFNLPVALSGCSYTPPATGINYSSSFCVGVIFRKQGKGFVLAWVRGAEYLACHQNGICGHGNLYGGLGIITSCLVHWIQVGSFQRLAGVLCLQQLRPLSGCRNCYRYYNLFLNSPTS